MTGFRVVQPWGPGKAREANHSLHTDCVFRFSREELIDELRAVDAERLRAAVDVKPVARLILHLGQQHHFPLEAGGARDPVAFRKHPDDFRMRMLRHHPDELGAIPLGHPVLRLNGFPGRDSPLECRVKGFVAGFGID